MFFVIPVGDVNRSERIPWVNHALILANIAVYLWMYLLATDSEAIVKQYAFVPAHPEALTSITSMFMHIGLGHLIGNMLFLYIFGDNVEETLGHFGYLVFYVAGGLFADFVHAHVISESMRSIPTLGASGAISAVMGAYVLLFPRASITYWGLFFLKTFTFSLSSWIAVGWWFLMQLLSHDSTGLTGVAYGAHIGGFIFGASAAGLLLIAGVISTNWLHSARERRMEPVSHQGEVLVPSATRGGYVRSTGACPACARPLQPPVEDECPPLDRCLTCGGIWLDPGEAEQVLSLRPMPPHLARPTARFADAASIPIGKRGCPRCRTPLEVTEILGVWMEACPGCRGIWADRFKLEELSHRIR